LGVGSAIGAGLAAKAPGASVTPAFSSAAGMMPMVGTTMMGVGTLRMVRKLTQRKAGRKNETNPEEKRSYKMRGNLSQKWKKKYKKSKPKVPKILKT